MGYVHVSDLLDSLSPKEFDERYAEYMLSGAGEARALTAKIEAQVYNHFVKYCRSKGGGGRQLEFTDFVEQGFRPDSTRKTKVTGQQVARHLGFKWQPQP